MIITRKYTYGDGTVKYVEEIIEEIDEDATEADYISALAELGVSE